jgi:putative ABC transport system substrate-binding protein
MKGITIVTLIAIVIALSLPAEAQQAAKIPRIGVLNASSAASMASRMEQFRQGLRDLGYIEGQNIVIEYRYADGKLNLLPGLATELVQLNVAVIVAGGGQSIRAAKTATNTIPIVMSQVVDPMEFVASLAKPGGNITGLSAQQAELGGKRLELLKEMVPRLSRVAVLETRGSRSNIDGPEMKEIKAAGQAMGLELQPVEIPRSAGLNDLEKAFAAISKGRANGVMGLSSPEFSLHRRRIAELAVKHRLPSAYRDSEFPDAGGLMSYGAQYSDLCGQDFERSETSRPACRAADEVRVRDQFKNREADRRDDSTVRAVPGGSGDSIVVRVFRRD